MKLPSPSKVGGILTASLLLFLTMSSIQQSLPPYRIIIGLQEVSCLPWKVFFWKKPDTVAFNRFDPVLFSARGMGPYIPDGMPVIKLVAGVPGDRVKIKEGKLYINDRFLDDLNDGIRAFKKPTNYWDKEYVLGDDEVFMFGSEPRSYDSRYWGPYPKHLVRGRVSALF